MFLETGGKVILEVANNLAELCSSVFWKVKLASDKTEYLAEEISKQSVEGVAWFLLTAYSKRWKERDELKKELLSRKKPEPEGLVNTQLIHIAKNEKMCPEENTKSVAEQPFD